MGCTGSKSGDGGVAVGRRHRPSKPRPDAQVGDANKNPPVPAGDGIPSFAPGAELSEAYAAYIREVRRAGVEAGVLRPVDCPHAQERASMVGNNKRASAAAAKAAEADEPAGGADEGGGREGRGGPARDGGVKGRAAAAGMRAVDGAGGKPNGTPAKDPDHAHALAATPPAPSVTIFQCRPMPTESLVGKGQYGHVALACMSLARGELTELEPQRARVLGESGGSPPPGLAGVEGGSPSSPPAMERGVVAGSARGPHDEHHYLIAMKEVPLLSSQPQALVFEEVRRQVQRWTRLSAYSPRILRCIQMECVYADRREAKSPGTGGGYRHQPAPRSSFHDFDGVIRPAGGDGEGSGGGGGGAVSSSSSSPSPGRLGVFRRRSHTLSAGKDGRSSSMLFADEPIQGVPSKLRLYMEFAKYGTLRTMQTREMPEKFNKKVLHELTARALMREVLLALLDVHEQGELQLDVCAKNVFLVRPIRSVYRTYFPAYIADLPAGALMKVPAAKLKDAVGLMNPTCTLRDPHHQQHQPLSSAAESVAGYSPNGAVPSPELAASLSQQYPNRHGIEHASPVVSFLLANAMHDGSRGGSRGGGLLLRPNHSMVVMPPMDLATGDASGAAFGIELMGSESYTHLHAGGKSGTGCVRNASATALHQHPYRHSPSTAVADGAGEDSGPADAIVMFSQSASYAPAEGHHDDFITNSSFIYNSLLMEEQRWQRDELREYMRRYRCEDYTTLPAPSPCDGIADHHLARAVTRMTVRDELDPPHECVRVYPLRDTVAGGVVVVSHDRYGLPPHPPRGPAAGSTDAPTRDASGRETSSGGPMTGRASHVGGAGDSASAGVGGGGARLGSAEGAPPQCLPRAADVSGYVLPPALAAGAGAGGADSLAMDLASLPPTGALRGGRGGLLLGSPFPAGHFRGPLIRLKHTAAIRRSLALTNTNTSLSSVPVYRFVSATHAAPEVLQRREFSVASDIFAFAMTFIELVTDPDAFMAECMPKDLPRPKTCREKEEYDFTLTATLNKTYNARIDAMIRDGAAAEEEQRLPDAIFPQHGPVVVRIPEHLSDECKNMLKWCLQTEPSKRPSAAELLRSKYFLLGDWIGEEAGAAGGVRLPEKPWGPEEGDRRSYELLAQAAGYPVIPESLFSTDTAAIQRPRAEA